MDVSVHTHILFSWTLDERILYRSCIIITLKRGKLNIKGYRGRSSEDHW